MKHCLFSGILLLSSYSFSQSFEDGTYTLTDGGYYSLDIEVCNKGYQLCSFIFKHDENVVTYSENGQWEYINSDSNDAPSGLYMVDEEEDSYRITHISGIKYKVTRNEQEYIMTIKK
jgi:hypothetical protein